MSSKRPKKSRATSQPLRPYGFCCPPESHYAGRPPRRYQPSPLKTSLPSLNSLHECPALRLRHHVIEPCPKGADQDGASSALKLSLHSLQEKGGKMMLGATESFIEAMENIERARKQAEYERLLDLWADQGKKRVAMEKHKWDKCDRPCWYADYSIDQLKCLKELVHTMFMDKEEKTTNRTLHLLHSMGMITEMAKLKTKDLRRLIDRYSTEPITFLYELYKVVTGNYFEDHARNDYECNERIIISGIVFLELPKIIVELHKRLPPVVTFEFPPRPTPQKLKTAKKTSSPLLQKLYLPVHWRRYDYEMIQWRKKCLTIMRPFAILPKNEEEERKKVDHSGDKMLLVVEEEEAERKNVDAADAIDKQRKIVDIHQSSANRNDVMPSHVEEDKKVESVGVEVVKQETAIVGADEIDNRDRTLFQAEMINWTTPPTPCPYKYQKLLKQTGPMNTDEQFFNQLKPTDPTKTFPTGRENLSFKLQHYLLDVEADFYKLTSEADKITGEVSKIAQEVFNPDPPVCDACCSCRQTKKSHAEWHATKHPHRVIDGVTVDADACGNDKTQIVGALAMHSPAASLPSVTDPPRVPSCEKIEKNKIITGATTTIDGEVVHELGGVTKTIEHVPEEILHPDVVTVDIRNVPSCACVDDKSDSVIDCDKLVDDDDDSCFAKKYRPDEVRAYTCKEFDKVGGRCGCGDDVGECKDDDGSGECGCVDDTPKCWEDSFEGEEEEQEGCEECESWEDDVKGECGFKDVAKQEVCKWCGMTLDAKCVDKNARILAKPNKKKKLAECSCVSLSEFLQLDLTQTKCCKPGADKFKKGDSKAKKKRSQCQLRMQQRKSKGKRLSTMGERMKRDSELPKKCYKFPASKEHKDEIEEDEAGDGGEPTEGGPFGLRTASEEALPTELTVAYLTKLHPPNYPAEQIAVREGGRPCKCRENRNNRKTLLYGIAGTTGENKPVIDGVTWLTPVPSLRNSQEYIPEYELYDSPYEKQICKGAKKSERAARAEVKIVSDETSDQERDWDNAFKDDYLTEFFTKSRDNIPCYGKTEEENKEPRKLKVMKPVCECKYERKIVKRMEERKKWTDRQKRLKGMQKESFLQISEVANPEVDEDGNVVRGCNVDITENPAQLVLTGVTMQTPCATPSQSGVRSNLPFTPYVGDEMKEKQEKSTLQEDPSVNKKKVSESEARKSKEAAIVIDDRKIASDKAEIKVSDAEGKKNKSDDERKRNLSAVSDKNNIAEKRKKSKQEDGGDKELARVETVKTRMRRRMSYYDEQEKELMMQLRLELASMRDDFLSTKLPHFDLMPQFSYWISCRVKGLHFTRSYKLKLMARSLKLWNALTIKPREPVYPEPIKVKRKDRHLLTFDRACYWKRKIAKQKLRFYTKLRQNIVSIGRDNWRLMEFGKFPHLAFKQAYFTYMPATEKDTYVRRPFI